MPPQNEPATATLTVSRGPADGLGDQYQIALRLDGAKLATLAPGETLTRTIEPGRHRLLATNTLMRKTVAFDAVAGSQVRFFARNRRGIGTDLFAALGAGWLYVHLEQIPSDTA